jgi:hypothetical protein
MTKPNGMFDILNAADRINFVLDTCAQDDDYLSVARKTLNLLVVLCSRSLVQKSVDKPKSVVVA